MSNFRRVVSVEIQVFTFLDVFAQVAWVGALRLRKVAFKFILKKILTEVSDAAQLKKMHK